LLNIVNFLHGVQYMLGALLAWLLLVHFGIGYWGALVIAPMVTALASIVIEFTLLRRIYKLDHLYGFLLTFGLALVIQGLLHHQYGSAPQTYNIPDQLSGRHQSRHPCSCLSIVLWVIGASIFVCLATWLLIEKTQIGAWLRAATENTPLVRAFGVKVPRLVTAVYGVGAGLAAFGCVMAAPIYQVNPLMGADIVVTVFAVVVAGGMGSIFGSVLAGFSARAVRRAD
jgi:branched-subunit amino acid ABC-type transport system permease component